MLRESSLACDTIASTSQLPDQNMSRVARHRFDLPEKEFKGNINNTKTGYDIKAGKLYINQDDYLEKYNQLEPEKIKKRVFPIFSARINFSPMRL